MCKARKICTRIKQTAICVGIVASIYITTLQVTMGGDAAQIGLARGNCAKAMLLICVCMWIYQIADKISRRYRTKTKK